MVKVLEFVVIVIIVLGLFVPSRLKRIIGPSDFCEHEHFEAHCENHQEIMMKSARYGRMKVGKCIDNDYPIGCSMDVLNVMDGLCSGKPACSVATVDPALMSAKIGANVCKSLLVYLEASYSCIDVIQQRGKCSTNSWPVDAKQGYISSRIATETGYGNPQCPWKLKLTGHIVNITLSKYPKQSDNSLLAPTSTLCYEIGRIKENREHKNIMVCGSDPQHKDVYISRGGDIEISFTEKAVLDTLGRFLIHYKASTCIIPKTPSNSFAVIRGHLVVIQCNNTNIKWEVGCDEVNQWSAEQHRCETTKEWNIEDIFSHDEISLGVVLVVALGLTVFICTIGFIVYILCYYCKRCNENAALKQAVHTRDYTEDDKKGTENLITFPQENEIKYRENTLKSNAGSSDTSSLDKRTISWPIRESFRHSSHADTLQFPDEHESESVSVEDETMNSNIPSEEVAMNVPDYGLPMK